MTAIRKHLTDFLAVLALIAVAGGVSYKILQNQRLRIPYLEEKPFILKAEFATGQAVTAGQGQTVRVAGVRIGDIGKVSLKEGRAIIEMHLDREYGDLVHSNATALLRPKTGLKDMFVDLEPGTSDAPVVKEGWTLPIGSTKPDVNPDEIFAALDTDTRDYLKLLVNGAGTGLKGRSGDLRDVFERFEPTHRDLARVSGAVATRRKNLRRLVNSLRKLNERLARDDDDLAGLIESSSSVLAQFAAEETNVSDAVRELPTALSQTTDTLTKVEAFARQLGPTAEKLRPAARALDDANKAIIPLARDATPQLRDSIRPFVRETRPFVRELKPVAETLGASSGDLTQSFFRLNHFFNLLAFNPNGKEPPENADRQEGYLFWLAWLQHMGANFFSISDAHGTFRPTTIAGPCSTLEQIVANEPALAALTNITMAVREQCPSG
jgi:phospholipid/cholesterol/gamma-HCH transport system substrate-binding protein